MFSKAIVRTPAKSIVNGITTANLGVPDYAKALAQHAEYISALEECGLEVTVLPADEKFADSTFVEDVALLTPSCAIITRPGTPSREKETNGIIPTLEKFYTIIEKIKAPATLEAGDVMMVANHFYIGLSERTNPAGATQLIKHLQKQHMTASVVTLSEVLHLKTGLGYLENNNLLACGEFIHNKQFRQFNILTVDKDEAYAANSVWINNMVLTPKGFPKTLQKIKAAGYQTKTVDVSEFQKIDGGLSCLSLRF